MYYDGRNYPEPYRKLACAILIDAYEMVRDYANSADAAERLKAVKDWLWFESEDTEEVFSFENICSYLHLDPDAIREALIAELFGDGEQN